MAKLTLPGLIDPHVHLRDPGQTSKEDFYTGTCAALAGGFTCILDMPNNKIPITTFEKLQEKISIAKEKIVCDVGFYFGSLGDNLDEFKKIKSRVVGLKLYLNETTGNFLIDKKVLKSIFLAWSNKKKSNQSMSLRSSILSSKSNPILVHAENDAVEYVIKIAKQTGQRTHFCHISATSDLKQIIDAKEKGIPVTCGVTPHHLFLTEDDVPRLGPYGRMKPFLKSKKDVDFLWKNLKAIDVIESDHAPHTKEEKESNTPPFGVPGLETTLPLLLTAVSEKRLEIDDILRLCFENPMKIFSIPHSNDTYHRSARVEVDFDKSYIIDNKSLHTKCGWSPFHGWKVKGKVMKVFIRGKKVFEDGQVLVSPGFGKILSS